MARWEFDLEVAVKGQEPEVTKMRERLCAIMVTPKKLKKADWIRSLFGEDLSKISCIADKVDKDNEITEAFNGFDYEWEIYGAFDGDPCLNFSTH